MKKVGYCKNVNAKVEMLPSQVAFFRQRLRLLEEPANKVARLLLFGYEGYDDGFFEALNIPTTAMTKKEFLNRATGFRRAVLETYVYTKMDKNGKEKTVRTKIRSRAFTAPLFASESSVGKSTWLAGPSLARLREIGVLPFATPGLCAAERYIVTENVVQFVRSLAQCNQRTIANFEQAMNDAKRLLKTFLEEGDIEEEEDGESKSSRHRAKVAVRRYLRMRKTSQVTLFSEEHPLTYMLGDNYVPFSLKNGDNKLLLSLHSGIFASNEPYVLSYGARKPNGNDDAVMCFGEMKPKTRRNLLHKLIVSDIGEHKTEYQFEFKENGKRHRKLTLHEPRLQFVPTKNSGFYLQMPLSGESEWENDFLAIYKHGSSFMRRWPKEVSGLNKAVDLRVLGVDLGVSRMFSWAVAKASAYQNGLPVSVDIEQTGYLPPVVNKELLALKSRLRDLGKLMAHTVGYKRLRLSKRGMTPKPLSIGDEDRARMKEISSVQTDDEIRELMASLNEMPKAKKERFEKEDRELDRALVAKFTTNVDGYERNVDSLPADLRKWNHDGVWKAGDFFRDARQEFGRLMIERTKRHVSCLPDDMVWDEIIEQMIRVSHKFNCIGQEEGERDENFMRSLYTLRTNHRLDLRKKLCRAIIDMAILHGCQVIAVEDLTHQPSTDRKSNQLWQMWSANMLITHLTQAAIPESILVVKVDPAYTSKTVYGKGLVGYRPKKERESLYYVENGKLCQTDADVNAAKNIAQLALTRHADTVYFKYRVENGKAVPVVNAPPEEWAVPQTDEEKQEAAKKREESQQEALENLKKRLERRLGKDWQDKLPPVTEDKNGKKKDHSMVWHDGRFITEQERAELMKDIERLYLESCPEASRSDEAEAVCEAVSA